MPCAISLDLRHQFQLDGIGNDNGAPCGIIRKNHRARGLRTAGSKVVGAKRIPCATIGLLVDPLYMRSATIVDRIGHTAGPIEIRGPAGIDISDYFAEPVIDQFPNTTAPHR